MSANALAIDFSRSRRPSSRLAPLLLAAGAALAIVAVQRFMERDETLIAAELQRASLQRKIDGVPREVVSVDPELRRLMAGAARVAGEIRVPWQALFADLEAAMDDSVALLALEPSVGKRQIQLAAEAKTLADALALVARLDATASFANARISQQEAKLSDGVPALGFRVQADWQSAP